MAVQDRTGAPSRRAWPRARREPRARDAAIVDNLRTTMYDVLVIGGGMTGSAVAREAALAGLSVALVEKDDLAAGTSSRSTKLLHGGLRYLEHGQVRLVREALREREITARLAPHLARPLPFLLPAVRGVFPGRLAGRAAVALYDLLAGPNPLGRGRGLGREDVASRLPEDVLASVSGGVLFADRQTEDARLTIAVARAAAARGALILPGHAVVALRTRGGAVAGAVTRRREDGASVEIEARVVVNAAGAWADRIRRMAGLDGDLVRPTRGAHIVVPDLGLRQAVMWPGRRPRHRLFAIPWRGATLFGTTDTDHDGGIDDVEATADDVDLLVSEVARLAPRASIDRSSILSTFAGLRPLVRAPGDSLALSREHLVVEECGLVSIVGGKLTTWRVMGRDVVAVAARRIGRGDPSPASAFEPLPGGHPPPVDADPRLARFDPGTRDHLLAIYGSEAGRIAAIAETDPGASVPIAPPARDVVAQIDFAVREEYARRAEDVLFRRLLTGHDLARVRDAASVVVGRMARLLGWSGDREDAERRAIATIAARRGGFAVASEER